MEMTFAKFDGLRVVCGIESIHEYPPVFGFCLLRDFDKLTPHRKSPELTQGRWATFSFLTGRTRFCSTTWTWGTAAETWGSCLWA